MIIFNVRPQITAVPKAYVTGANMEDRRQKLKNEKRPGKRSLTGKCVVADQTIGIKNKNAARI